jgi:hypothetical protein
MDKRGDTQASRMRAYLCSTCARRWLVVAERAERRCICGGALTPALLSPGQYQLVEQGAASPSDVHDSPSERHESRQANDPIRQESDLGYGQSHGYDVGHGGPTGPGDMPAK